MKDDPSVIEEIARPDFIEAVAKIDPEEAELMYQAYLEVFVPLEEISSQLRECNAIGLRDRTLVG